jgi:hypothetical protein
MATVKGREHPAVNWRAIDEQTPAGTPVLVTASPEPDEQGVLATRRTRRTQHEGRWRARTDWCDNWSGAILDPQPTHWRPNPHRGSLV